ncbi:MAG: type II toxin-antitoxin system Phd/YefM family antitoxin [Byssovorax sp.]
MKQSLRATPPPPARPRRLGVAEAKSRLSEVLRDAASGPMIIHSRGHDVAVVLAIDDYTQLVADHEPASAGGAAFLARVEALRAHHGGGVDNFEPTRLEMKPERPFARPRRPRG